MNDTLFFYWCIFFIMLIGYFIGRLIEVLIKIRGKVKNE